MTPDRLPRARQALCARKGLVCGRFEACGRLTGKDRRPDTASIQFMPDPRHHRMFGRVRCLGYTIKPHGA